jgi:hypothetical protein
MTEPIETSGGTCRLCGCTDKSPCPGNCAWFDASHTLCTRCVDADVLIEAAAREVTRGGGTVAPIDLDAAGAMVLLAFLQMALRHPDLPRTAPGSRVFVVHFAGDLHMLVTALGPACSELAFRGWRGTGVDPAISIHALAPNP